MHTLEVIDVQELVTVTGSASSSGGN